MFRFRGSIVCYPFIGLILIATGTITLYSIAKVFIEDEKSNKYSASTTAVIYNIKPDHTVYICYTVSDVEYTTTLDHWSIFMDKGDKIKIKYDPHNPEDIVSHRIESLIFIIIFFPATVITGIYLIFYFIRYYMT